MSRAFLLSSTSPHPRRAVARSRSQKKTSLWRLRPEAEGYLRSINDRLAHMGGLVTGLGVRQLPPGLAGHQRATAEVDCSQAKPRRPSAICYPSSSARRAKSRATVQQVKRIRACNVTWRLDPSRSTLTWLAVAPGPRTIPFLPLRRSPAARHLRGVSLADRKGPGISGQESTGPLICAPCTMFRRAY